MQSGPFPSVDGRALSRLPTLETRLPQLFVVAFVLLMVVQVVLRGG